MESVSFAFKQEEHNNCPDNHDLEEWLDDNTDIEYDVSVQSSQVGHDIAKGLKEHATAKNGSDGARNWGLAESSRVEEDTTTQVNGRNLEVDSPRLRKPKRKYTQKGIHEGGDVVPAYVIDLSKEIEEGEDEEEEEQEQVALENRLSILSRGLFRASRRRLSIVGGQDSLNMASLSKDTYSFFIFSKVFDFSTLIASVVFMVQTLLFGFVMADTVDLSNSDNPLGIPSNTSPVVRSAQFFLAILAVYMSNDIREANIIVANGYSDEGIGATFNDSDGLTSATKMKWIFSIVLRVIQGLLSLVVILTRLMVERTVIDLLFNFTALEFVSAIDNVVFFLALEGYLGPKLLRAADKVSERSFPIEKQSSRAMKVVSSWITIFLILCGLSFWSVIFFLQERGTFMCKLVYVQFNDDFSLDMAAFSGLYQLEYGGVFQRKYYSQSIPGNKFDGKAILGFCASESAWTLSFDEELDPCKWNAKSSAMDNYFSFDILDAADSPWYTTNNGAVGGLVVTLQNFQLACYDCEGPKQAISCNHGGICSDNQCICAEGRYGHRCEFDAPCTSMNIDSRYEGFLSSRIWSKNYKILTSEDGKVIDVYGRPVYVSEGTTPTEVMLFNGRRWALTTVDLLGVSEISSIQRDFHAYSYWGNPVFAFISEPMDTDSPKDGVSPLGLDWYLIPLEDQDRPDIKRVVFEPGAELICEICDESTNPCAFEGLCTDGICHCVSGSFGTLCQIPPIGNGKCNSRFNTPEFNYDGGDCCRVTCESSDKYKCGTSLYSTVTKEPAFGLFSGNVYTGYDSCKDPEHICESSNNCMKASSSGIPFDMTYDDSSRGFYMHFAVTGRTVVVSGDGNHVAVGEPGLDYVKVYRQNGKDWEQLGNGIDGPKDSRYGFAVDLSDDGSVLAIGAPYVDNTKGTVTDRSFEWGETPGFVRVYQYDPSARNWLLRGQEMSSGVDAGDLFGIALSLSSNGMKIAIGCPRLDVSGLSSVGIVKIYNFDTTVNIWVQEGEDITGDLFVNEFQFFGYALSLNTDGDKVVIGAPELGDIYHLGKYPLNERDGYVRVFKLASNGEWSQIGMDILPDAEQSKKLFGFAVAIASTSNGHILVAIGDPGGGIRDGIQNDGVVKVFQYEENSGDWSQVGEDIFGRGSWVWFGKSIALSRDGSVLAAGATVNFSLNSYAQCFDMVPGVGWQERRTDNIGAVGQDSAFNELPGYIVSLSNDGNVMVVGQTGNDGTGRGETRGEIKGQVRAYHNPDGGRNEVPKVPLTLLVKLVDPRKIGISFACGNVVHVSLMPGAILKNPQEEMQETFLVLEGAECTLKFTSLDVGNGGIQYRVYFGTNVTNELNLLAKGRRGSFFTEESVSFRSSAPTDIVLVPITIRLRLDRQPTDTAMDIACGSSNQFEANRGGFTESFGKVLSTFYVEKGSECHLTIRNYGGFRGMCCTDSFGSYQVYYGDEESVNITDTSNLLLYGNGVFEIEDVRVFIAALNETSELLPPSTFGIQETRPKEPSSSSMPVTIQIILDDKPHETGFRIKCNDGYNIYFQPSTFVGMENMWLVETLPLEEGTQCQFTVEDTGEDGLCCGGSVRIYNGFLLNRDHIFAETFSFGPKALLNFTVNENGAVLDEDIFAAKSLCYGRATFVGSEIAGMVCRDDEWNHLGDSNMIDEETCFERGGKFIPYTCDGAESHWVFLPAEGNEHLQMWWRPKCCTGIPSDPSDALITLAFDFDGKPHETWWKLNCGGSFEFESTAGDFKYKHYARDSISFIIPEGRDCHLTVFDNGGDGMCCGFWLGAFEVFYGRDITDTSNILAYSGGIFGSQEDAHFKVSREATLATATALTMNFQLDYLPHEIGFSLKCDDGTNISAPPGVFAGATVVIESFVFDGEETKCQFSLEDAGGNGLCCADGQGYLRLHHSLFETSSRASTFVEIIDFGAYAETNFTISKNMTSTTDYEPDSICSVSRHFLVGDAIAGFTCTTGGDSNDGMTSEETCIESGGTWYSYNCNDVERDYFVFQDEGTKAFLRTWWESKCCAY